MSVYTCMFKIDSGCTIRTYNDLKLVIPSVSTRPHLFSFLQTISPTQKVAAQVGQVLRSSVVQAHDKQRVVHNIKACFVVSVLAQHDAETRPNLAILS